MSDLKSCPFCESLSTYYDQSSDCAGTPMAGCLQCGAHVNAFSKQEAIAAWNRRAPAAPATPAPSSHAISKAWAERMLPLDEGATPSAGAPTPARDELLDKAEALDCLREMLGHVSNGSNEAVTISQDDATGAFIVRAGKSRNWGWSLVDALRQQREDEATDRAALRDAGGTDGN